MLITKLVVSFLVYCRLEVRCGQAGVVSGLQAPNLQPTANQERNYQCGNQHYSRELLMMGIVVPETCRPYKKYNKIIRGIQLVFILHLSERLFLWSGQISCIITENFLSHLAVLNQQNIYSYMMSKRKSTCWLHWWSEIQICQFISWNNVFNCYMLYRSVSNTQEGTQALRKLWFFNAVHFFWELPGSISGRATKFTD